MTEPPTGMVERRAEKIAREAAELAARLAREDAERNTALVVARALKDDRVDRELLEHSEHLREVNGSQKKMATSLERVERTLERQEVATTAISDYVAEQGGKKFKRWQTVAATLAALAAYGSIIAVLIAGAH